MYHKIRSLTASLTQTFRTFYDQQDKRLFYWVPVFYGLGIALYFSLSTEPLLQDALILTSIALSLTVLSRIFDRLILYRLCLALTLTCLGFTAVKFKADTLHTQQLKGEVGFQPLEGTLTSIERLPSHTRIILDEVVFTEKMKPGRPIPHKIRLSLRGKLQPGPEMILGTRVSVKASLSPPGRPVAPGAYDFRRRAYFDGIGAVGFALTPLTPITEIHTTTLSSPEHLAPPLWTQARLWIAQQRTALTDYMRSSVPGESGGIMAALVTGDRAGISDETRQAYADAGIAHILAISGLHLSIVAGLVFFVLRGLLSLIPPLALRYNTKKLAAFFALIFTFLYLIVSGYTIPAQRSFIMTGLILVAVMTDRVALTLRNVALAAFLVLLLSPESLVGPSFQLSFAAVIGLVAAYERFQPTLLSWQVLAASTPFPGLSRAGLYFFGMTFSSLVATLATAPFTIFTFNRFSLVALLTNLMDIPLISFIIMPLIVFTLLTAPLTMELLSPFLEKSISLMTASAYYAQKLPGAVILAPSVNLWIQGTCIVGLLWLALIWGRHRLWGLVPIMGSLAFIPTLKQPNLFIPQEQNLIAFYDTSNRMALVNTLQGGRFARKCWLQHIAQTEVHKISPDQHCPTFQEQTPGTYFLKSPTTTYRIDQQVEEKWRKKHHSLTLSRVHPDGSNTPLLSPKDFRYKGGHYIWFKDNGDIETLSVADHSGHRPWR